MSMKETCYGCDYFFNAEELIEVIDSQFPDNIKLCQECDSKTGGESNE